MGYRWHPSSLITPALSLQTFIACCLPDYLKNKTKQKKKCAFFCIICGEAHWDLSSTRSLALAFGKHIQGLSEITPASPSQLAPCSVCSQQKLSAPVNSPRQAAEATSHRPGSSLDSRTAHGGTELWQLTQSIISKQVLVEDTRRAKTSAGRDFAQAASVAALAMQA